VLAPTHLAAEQEKLAALRIATVQADEHELAMLDARQEAFERPGAAARAAADAHARVNEQAGAVQRFLDTMASWRGR
jgi:hypothetical protein